MEISYQYVEIYFLGSDYIHQDSFIIAWLSSYSFDEVPMG